MEKEQKCYQDLKEAILMKIDLEKYRGIVEQSDMVGPRDTCKFKIIRTEDGQEIPVTAGMVNTADIVATVSDYWDKDKNLIADVMIASVLNDYLLIDSWGSRREGCHILSFVKMFAKESLFHGGYKRYHYRSHDYLWQIGPNAQPSEEEITTVIEDIVTGTNFENAAAFIDRVFYLHFNLNRVLLTRA